MRRGLGKHREAGDGLGPNYSKARIWDGSDIVIYNCEVSDTAPVLLFPYVYRFLLCGDIELLVFVPGLFHAVIMY